MVFVTYCHIKNMQINLELCNFFRNFEGWEGGEVPPGMASPGSLTHCHEKR